MFRKSVVAITAAALLCGSALTLSAVERSSEDRVLAAQSRLSLRLIRQLANERGVGNNLVVSPASLAAVLALLDVGADPAMRAALYKTLGFDADHPDAAAVDLENLRALVTKLGKGVDDKDTILALANWIVFDPKSQPVEEALRKLRAAGARVTQDDLSGPATIKAINDWVAEKTKGLIPAILDQGPKMPGLVAVDALYFKGTWLDQFAKTATHTEAFHLLGGTDFEVQMMAKLFSRIDYREEGRFVAIDLPYKNSRFSLVVITTSDKPASANEFSDVVTWLYGDGFASGRVRLSLPRFTIEDKNEMLDALDKLGLKAGRNSPTALAGLAINLAGISEITQKTYLRVDEEGSEAAAATAVSVERSAMPRGETVEMKVDKPFMFALRDSETGLLLMSGYVARPAPVKTAAQ
ncbi:MAG TPA: serpin family protein [Xanthobacteraceae bacterium]|nr:serpin family protein [Xanthobacteraceae bacterium]